MNKRIPGLLLALLAAMVLLPAHAADKGKKYVGVEKNSYGSEFTLLSDTSIRVTTRKKVQGTLDEINTPGTSTYTAFQNVVNAAVYRAALEGNALGFKALKVSGTRNLSETSERRSASSCPGGFCEKDFQMAPGTYFTDVELSIELTMDMYKELPEDPAGYIDVENVLKQFKK